MMAHRVLYKAPEVRRHILPIDFFHEVRNKIGSCLTVRIGDMISNAMLQRLGHPKAVTEHLGEVTRALAHRGAARRK